MFDKILNYLTQNSTWRGIIAIATAAGVQVSPEQSTAIVSAGLGLIGVINVFRNGEKK